MRFTGKEEQQRVATELEQPASVRHSEVEQGDKAAPDGSRELLGTDLPVPGEALGQFGEPRDVDKRHRADLFPVAHIGHGGDPVDDQPREVRRERMLRLSVDGRSRAAPRCAPRGPTHGRIFSHCDVGRFEQQLYRQPLFAIGSYCLPLTLPLTPPAP